MDEAWKQQLKAKAPFMLMVILGGCLSVFFLGCIAAEIFECLIMLPGSLFCVIFGGIKIGSVRKYNKRIKEQYLASCRTNNVVEQPPNVVFHGFAADEINKYYQLFQNGAITQEEFEAKKNQLLNL